MLTIANPHHPSHVAVIIAEHLDHRVNRPVDGRARITHRHGNGVHQKRHVIGHRPQGGQPPGPGGRFQVDQGFFRVALESHHPVLLGDMEKLFGGSGGERGLAAHLEIGRHETAEQGLMLNPDVGGNQCFQLGL